jgi:hypothetical protein
MSSKCKESNDNKGLMLSNLFVTFWEVIPRLVHRLSQWSTYKAYLKSEISKYDYI